MRKLGIAVALAAALCASAFNTTPARADAGATVAAITSSVVAILSIKCAVTVDSKTTAEYPCILAPLGARAQFCGFVTCPTDPKGNPVPASQQKNKASLSTNRLVAWVQLKAVAIVKAKRHDIKFPRAFTEALKKQNKIQVAQTFEAH